MELLTKRVWDYVGDNYVHRLLQSKNGQLVEVPGANVGSSDVEDPQVIRAFALRVLFFKKNPFSLQWRR